MKTIRNISAASLLLFAGCVTMPDPVPDAYLMRKTPEEGTKLEKIENAVIAKNHEIKDTQDRVKATRHSLDVEKGRLSILMDEKNLLLEKQKQYVLENDQAKLDETRKMLAVKDNDINSQSARVDYTTALLEQVAAQKDVAEAELAVRVAELSYEKAVIAKDYLLKLQAAAAEAGEKDKGKSSLDAEKYDEKYRKYLDKQREILSGKKNALDQASVKLKIAEEKLKK
ncbi:MAG: hypothetical protein A2W19_02735 [Spirochaetes bacterium RBG_16_49_21]|nr:MAG: hypothetical protein A2W19_02735 [Spirochaetes bacterium RBG_16_49_21]